MEIFQAPKMERQHNHITGKEKRSKLMAKESLAFKSMPMFLTLTARAVRSTSKTDSNPTR
jgi:hypothetical protein